MKNRTRVLWQAAERERGANVVWLFRDLRLRDNWAVYEACRSSSSHGSRELQVWVFPEYFGEVSGVITERRFLFLRSGLKRLQSECRAAGTRLIFVFRGDPVDWSRVARVTVDFSPLSEYVAFLRELLDAQDRASLPTVVQVDAHNLTPCWLASDKKEYSAYTLRRRLGDDWRTDLAPPPALKAKRRVTKSARWDRFDAAFAIDRSVPFVPWMAEKGERVLESFIRERLARYDTERNDPNAGVLSGLSPWLNFGFVSVRRAAAKVLASGIEAESFLEELVVRRELAENFCHYSEAGYTTLACAPQWARTSLYEHTRDPRGHVYSERALERAETHDALWNAAQVQMTRDGKMHSFMRMYWAKKILEWSTDPEEGLAISIRLNDKYSLDGRDPNGYVGCLWSVCAVHDRAWKERPVFGKVRYMNRAGCARKFDVNRYIREMLGAAEVTR